ncbi:MAG TPA: hypothetical protein VKG24_29130 [Pseudolabrys sp.]|nr:hypothetical protein [Pseudolabrys sp.]
MNPGGVVEESSKVATSLIGAMKEQPYLLASTVLNFAMIGLFAYGAVAMHDTRVREVALVYEHTKEVQELLARCVVPP